MFSFNKDSVILYWKAVSKNKFVQFGTPIFVLVLGGSAYLKQFTSLRYEYSNVKKNLKPEEIEGLTELKAPGEVTLESEYEKIKEVDLDNWTNIRGPRPWEETQEGQAKR